MTVHAQVLRPCDLAERWQCSEGHVRTLARRGVLPFFRAGGKLLRFRLHDVEACLDGMGIHYAKAVVEEAGILVSQARVPPGF